MNVLRRNIAAILLLAVFTGAAAYFAARPHVGQPKEEFFTVLTLPLTRYDGTVVRLTTLAPKPLVAYVWASWCPYCQEGFRQLSAARERHPGVAFVAINRAEPMLDAKGFTDKIGLPNGILYLLDPSDSFYKMVGGFAMPEYLFVDSQKEVVAHVRGPLTEEELEQMLARIE